MTGDLSHSAYCWEGGVVGGATLGGLRDKIQGSLFYYEKDLMGPTVSVVRYPRQRLAKNLLTAATVYGALSVFRHYSNCFLPISFVLTETL